MAVCWCYGAVQGVGKGKTYEGSWVQALNQAGFSVAGQHLAVGADQFIRPAQLQSAASKADISKRTLALVGRHCLILLQ